MKVLSLTLFKTYFPIIVVGAVRSEDSLEIMYARQKLVLVAKAFNLQAIDMVYIKYKGRY